MGKKSKRRASNKTTVESSLSGSFAGISDHITDEIGRCFCKKHRRVTCHECCLAFDISNEEAEISAGLRKKPSEADRLADQRAALVRGIKFMREQRQPSMMENLRHHETQLQEVEAKLEATRVSGDESVKVEEALYAAEEKFQAQDAQRDAVVQAFQRENPEANSMEWGGAETQRLFEEFASAPPTDDSRVDKFTCVYCKKASAEKLDLCGRCKRVAYCSEECQRAAWPAHKKECSLKEGKIPKSLPLSWREVEAHDGQPVMGRVLEVRAIQNESFTRQVFGCKDRDGVVKRIAAYTDSRKIPGLEQGCILRWRNPRFHWFMDGSSGARIEQEDLPNVTISK